MREESSLQSFIRLHMWDRVNTIRRDGVLQAIIVIRNLFKRVRDYLPSRLKCMAGFCLRGMNIEYAEEKERV